MGLVSPFRSVLLKDSFMEFTKASVSSFDAVMEIHFRYGIGRQNTVKEGDVVDVLQFGAINCNSDVWWWLSWGRLNESVCFHHVDNNS